MALEQNLVCCFKQERSCHLQTIPQDPKSEEEEAVTYEVSWVSSTEDATMEVPALVCCSEEKADSWRSMSLALHYQRRTGVCRFPGSSC